MSIKTTMALVADTDKFPQRAFRATCLCRKIGTHEAWREGATSPVFAVTYVAALHLARNCFKAMADAFGWELDETSIKVDEIAGAPEPQLGDELADAKAKIGVLLQQRNAKNLEVETLRAELNELRQRELTAPRRVETQLRHLSDATRKECGLPRSCDDVGDLLCNSRGDEGESHT